MKVGIVVGRFQVPALHPGHIHLIEEARRRSDRIVVIIGAKVGFDERNALPIDVIMEMIKEYDYDIDIGTVMDRPGDDKAWSEELDRMIEMLLGPGEWAVLYGSRDSFIPHYKGKYQTEEIPGLPGHSGTELRQKIDYVFNEDFRKGIFYAFHHLKL
jgi:bifunctional NMN adenylyltransferase/nudix hydrolase